MFAFVITCFKIDAKTNSNMTATHILNFCSNLVRLIKVDAKKSQTNKLLQFANDIVE